MSINAHVMEWAAKWGIPRSALLELFDHSMSNDNPLAGMSEESVSQRIELHASKQGARLWRNNVGAYQDDNGNFVRYGLCNKSKQMNKKLKSSDFIGITPVTVTPQMVGGVVGIFTAVEAKKGDWKWSGSNHEIAQDAYIKLVQSLGGIGGFENGSGLFYREMGR